MKFIVSILLMALLSFALGLYLPWWSLALVAFVVAALIHQRAGKAFLSGFLALFLLWGILAFIIDANNDHVLSVKVAELLPLGGSSLLLILVTALIAGLVGGLAAMAGSYVRTIKD
jgi:hypothetical protein